MDAYYERGLKRWDEAAGRLLVHEAGGVTATWTASPTAWSPPSTRELLDELLPLLA